MAGGEKGPKWCEVEKCLVIRGRWEKEGEEDYEWSGVNKTPRTFHLCSHRQEFLRLLKIT